MADLAVPAAPSATKSVRKTHTVKQGDSLWQIARRYSVNITQLQRWNHLRGQTLKPGQILQVSETN
jgi:membrane-bound lytic murein transglycosylase D